MQESRLFRILYYVLEKGRATAPELAERFEVSVRTIYRDIDALSGAGIPIYTEAGRNGGIYLMDEFVLDKAVLSEEERREILAALQNLHATRNICVDDTLRKLSALFQVRTQDWLEVDFSRWGNSRVDTGKFELLRSAVLQRKSVKIHYTGSQGVAGERVIQPLKLMYKDKAWYLKAFCTQRQACRIFKLNRILDSEVLEESFPYRSYSEPEELPEQKCTRITLRFPKEMAYRVYDEFDAAHVKRQENGDLIASAKMPEDAWLVGFLLSFGTQVEVVEPVRLREVLAKQAKLIYEKNKFM